MQNVEVKTETTVHTSCDICGRTMFQGETYISRAGAMCLSSGMALNYGLNLIVSNYSSPCRDVCAKCAREILLKIMDSMPD